MRRHQSIASRLAQLKRHHEAELLRVAKGRPQEHIVSIEIMCIAIASFRRSEHWQAIGLAGRWFNAWMSLWGFVSKMSHVEYYNQLIEENMVAMANPRLFVRKPSQAPETTHPVPTTPDP